MRTQENVLIEGEKQSVGTHDQLTATNEENNQHNEAIIVDIPEDLPAPPKPPERPVQHLNEPLSVELKEGRRSDPSSDGNEHRVETNVPCQEVKLGGHLSEPEVSRGVESDWRYQIDGEDVGYDGK